MSKIVQSGWFVPLEILFRPGRMIKKFINEESKLSKKVTLNDIIKTTTDSKKITKNLKNASDKALGSEITLIWNKRSYESN